MPGEKPDTETGRRAFAVLRMGETDRAKALFSAQGKIGYAVSGGTAPGFILWCGSEGDMRSVLLCLAGGILFPAEFGAAGNIVRKKILPEERRSQYAGCHL